MLAMAVPVTLQFRPDGTLAGPLDPAEIDVIKQHPRYKSLEFWTREQIPDSLVTRRARVVEAEMSSMGRPVPTPVTGALRSELNDLLPADLAFAMDIIFLEVAFG